MMNVRIVMMGEFRIVADGVEHADLVSRSRKGVSLIRYLILRRGNPVTSQRLNRELDSGRHCENPESAIKTLISRTRAMLNGLSADLGRCIVSTPAGYKWQSLEGVTVDVLEVMDLLAAIRGETDRSKICEMTERLIDLYTGDSDDNYGLHRDYLEAVYRYADLLKESESYNRIYEVCRRVLKIDAMDEHLHILLMEAMINLNRPQEAMEQYRLVTRQSREYFDAEPSEALKAEYRTLMEAGNSIRFNLDVIHNELTREERDARGPYFSDYRAFKEIYNIQIRNLERLGSTMFLGVIMLSSRSAAGREGGMAVLMEVLKANLRRGDIVTRFSEDVVAMLLPTVNYTTGNSVMERIEKVFCAEYPSRNVTFHARISPLGGG